MTRFTYYNRMGMPADQEEWVRSFDNPDDRIVRQSRHKGRKGEVWISTVFLGLNHQWDSNMPPLIFETMVFPVTASVLPTIERHTAVVGEVVMSELHGARYSTEEQALAGHKRLVCAYG